MTAPPPQRAENRTLAAATAALLEQGRTLDGLSRLLTAGALILLLLLAFFGSQSPFEPSVMLAATLALIVLLGLAELYFAFRVGLDAALFRAIAADPASTGLPALDASLAALGLRPATATTRSLEDRIVGARALLRRQASCLALQIATMVVAAGLLALQ